MEVREAEVEATPKGAGKAKSKGVVRSPQNGAVLPPGKGRPAGVKNKLTNLRDAVLEAFDQVGGTQYLARLAQGSSTDRAAFVGLLAKVLPTQISANIDGGIRLELGWLGGRQVGTGVSQLPQPTTQVLDLQRENDGSYRIIDPQPVAQGADQARAEGGQAVRDPHPPQKPGEGG